MCTPSKPSPAAVDAVVTGYPSPYRRRMREFLSVSQRRLDVARQHPLLAFYVAHGLADRAHTQRAVKAIDQGRELADIGRIVQLPPWTRAFPASAAQLPLGPLPIDTDKFTIDLLNILQKHPPLDGRAATLLRDICTAHALAGRTFSLWYAGLHHTIEAAGLAAPPIRALALWFSLSAADASCPARALVRTPWTRATGLQRGTMATKALLRRLLLVLTLSEEGLADPWFKASACEGLRFTPLTRSPDILAVAERAENCMDWLYERLVRNQARFFSVQDAVGDDVAYVEVMAHASAQGAISISQVKGPRNAAVAPSIAKIAHRWLAERVKLDGLPRIAPGDLREIPPGRWAALLGPAIASAPAGSALADAPTIVQLRAIEDEITALSAHLRVAGWNKL